MQIGLACSKSGRLAKCPRNSNGKLCALSCAANCELPVGFISPPELAWAHGKWKSRCQIGLDCCEHMRRHPFRLNDASSRYGTTPSSSLAQRLQRASSWPCLVFGSGLAPSKGALSAASCSSSLSGSMNIAQEGGGLVTINPAFDHSGARSTLASALWARRLAPDPKCGQRATSGHRQGGPAGVRAPVQVRRRPLSRGRRGRGSRLGPKLEMASRAASNQAAGANRIIHGAASWQPAALEPSARRAGASVSFQQLGTTNAGLSAASAKVVGARRPDTKPPLSTPARLPARPRLPGAPEVCATAEADFRALGAPARQGSIRLRACL